MYKYIKTDAYKRRLEEILNDIILISEVAELSVESDTIATLIGIEKQDVPLDPHGTRQKFQGSAFSAAKWLVFFLDDFDGAAL